MSPRRRGRQTFISLLFTIAVVSLAIWAGNFASSTVMGDSLATTPATSLPVTPQIITSSSASSSPDVLTGSNGYRLVLLVKSSAVSQIVLLDPETEERQVVYTDQDEQLKIKQLGNVSGTEALVLLAEKDEDFGGSLWAISLDGSGRATKLIDNFTSPWPPVFSPNGQKIAYVSFSSNDAGATFALVVASRDGGKPQVVTRDSLPLTQPIFAPDGQRLAYVRQSGETGSGEILSTSLTGGQTKTLATFADRVPYDLAWSSDGAIAFIDGPGQQGDLFEVPNGETEPRRLSNLTGQENHPVYRPDGAAVAFTQTTGGKSTLYLLDRAPGSAKTLGSATMVVGWIERGFDE